MVEVCSRCRAEYSSATPETIPSARTSTKAISRPNARERICSRSARSLLTTSPSVRVIRTGEILRVSEPRHSSPESRRSFPVPRILGSSDLASGPSTTANCRSPSSPRSGHLGGVQLLSHNCPDFRISPGGFGVNMMEAHDVGEEAAPKAERLGATIRKWRME